MALDPYGPCPCGSGKKLKFCCSDLTSEMEKIERMLSGEQRVACLEYLKTLLAAHPDRASLLGLRAMLEMQLEQPEQAEQTLNHLLEKHPNNPIGLAELAFLKTFTVGARAAVEPLGKALEQIGDQMPERVYEALGAVGQTFLVEGDILAARAHLSLQAAVAGEEDPRAAMLLMRLLGSPQVPALLKDDWQLSTSPADVPWKNEFDVAYQHAAQGLWFKAQQEFSVLIEPSGNAPQVWRNVALTRLWTADHQGGIEAVHRYASLDVPLDEAVEFEALAQLLDPNLRDQSVEVIRQNVVIAQFDELTEKLAGDRRATRVPIESYFARMGREEGPPPRSAFALLDRPELSSGVDVELALGDIPQVVGWLYLFGRETDREPRVELFATGRGRLEKALTTLREIAGDALGESQEEDVLSRTSLLADALSWNWRLPPDLPAAQRESLIQQNRRKVLFEDWPELALPALENQTPATAAQNPALRVKVLAAILLLELAIQPEPAELDFNQLRAQLGLPTADPIDPATLPDREFVTLPQLLRLQVDKLSDEELIQHYRRAAVMGIRQAGRRLALEVIGRESLNNRVDKAEAYGLLAELESDPQRALEYVNKARDTAEAQGQSSATWDLVELEMSIEQGHTQAAQAMLAHIRQAHGREPGIMQRLVQILIDAGVLNPDGTPAGPPPEASPGIVLPGAAASSEGSKLWTPDSAASAGGEKKLWTPD